MLKLSLLLIFSAMATKLALPLRAGQNEGFLDEDLPFFTNVSGVEVFIAIGHTAQFTCFVKNLGDKSVSWIRKKDLHVLSVGTLLYTNDGRFSVSSDEDLDSWTLTISEAGLQDSGIYECQINTEPKQSLAYILDVVEAKAEILGAPDMFLESGSTLNVTCVVRATLEPPGYIIWYYDGEPLNYTLRGGLSIITDHSVRPQQTSLLLSRATSRDSGTYMCEPSNAEPGSIRIHVMDGDTPAAMHDGKNSAHTGEHYSMVAWLLLVLLIQR